jgi:hypothetical protein
MMLGWVVKIILFLLLIRLAVTFVRGLLQGMSTPVKRAPAAGDAVPLVRDPACGTYVVRARALTAGEGRDRQYFCSERCRESWMRKEAARRSA